MATKRHRQSSPSEGEATLLSGQIRMLRRRPGRTVYLLPELSPESAEVQWLTVGQGEHCDFVVEGAEDVHCSLKCTRGRVLVQAHPGARTEVNDVPVVEGQVELFRGSVLTLGRVRLVACQVFEDRPNLVVPGAYDMIRASQAIYESKAAAARGMGVDEGTFYRWIKEEKFKIASLIVLLCAAGVGYWGLGGSEQEHGATLRPAAAAPASVETGPSESRDKPSLEATRPAKADGEQVSEEAPGLMKTRERGTRGRTPRRAHAIPESPERSAGSHSSTVPQARNDTKSDDSRFSGFSVVNEPEFVGFSRVTAGDALAHEEGPDEDTGAEP